MKLCGIRRRRTRWKLSKPVRLLSSRSEQTSQDLRRNLSRPSGLETPCRRTWPREPKRDVSMSEVTTTRPSAVQNSIDLHSAQPASLRRRIRRKDAGRPLLNGWRRTSRPSLQRPRAGLLSGRLIPPASSQRKVEATREPILDRAAPLWIPGPPPSLVPGRQLLRICDQPPQE